VAGLEVDKSLVAHAGEGHGENDDQRGDEGEVVGDEPGDGVELALLDAVDDVSLGSDAALKSRDNLCFFEDVGVEGFFAF
jgi:hypothetical protein